MGGTRIGAGGPRGRGFELGVCELGEDPPKTDGDDDAISGPKRRVVYPRNAQGLKIYYFIFREILFPDNGYARGFMIYERRYGD